MRRAAYEYCRPMEMKEMGRRYLQVFAKAVAHRLPPILAVPALDTLSHRETRLPQINLKHLRLMTDGTGLLQHATFTVPNRAHGYCVDDNARALIVATTAQDLNRLEAGLTDLSSIYLSFLADAFNAEAGRFRNLMSYDRQWLEDVGSEDSHGRALWALGVMVGWGRNDGQVAVATQLFRAGLPALEHFSASRAIAFPILGIQAFLRRNGDDAQARQLMSELGGRLENRFRQFATEDWRWHEEMLTYDNARLPQALMACGRTTGDHDMVALGMNVLEWLRDIQLDPAVGWFAPIGNRGWFSKSGAKAQYDQQPLEAAAMIGACIEAYEYAHEEEWIELASTCFDWYLGKNDQQIKLYDHATGGCRDGLQQDGANENQGAESTLSYALSLLAIYSLRGLTTNEGKIQVPESESPLAGRAGKRLKSAGGP